MAGDLHRPEAQPGNQPAFRSVPPISWPFERQCTKINEFVTWKSLLLLSIVPSRIVL
jgi:hypothetical protein